MTNWTSYQQVLDTWVGEDKPEDNELITALIDKAETIILAAYPRIQERINNGSLNIKIVNIVVVDMVERVLRNPEGKTSYSYTTGPFAESANFSGNQNKGMILTNQELTLLAPNTRNKASSVDLKAGSNKVYNQKGYPYYDKYTTGMNQPWVTIEIDSIDEIIPEKNDSGEED